LATNKEKLIAGAQKLVEKGQFDKAIKEYLKVVQTDDKDVRVWLKIGDLYAKLGKKQEATETYQKVAEFYSDQGFYLKSVAVYKQILKIDPRLVDVNQRLAELYKQLGLLSDAMQQYEAVAAFWHREGKTREALAALKQIVELDPETVANRIKLAELYSKEGMAREAIDEFTRAAEQLKEQGRTDDYMKVAERLLFHSPDNRPVSRELARLYIEKGDPRRALPKLQVCFKADPRDTEVLSLLAKAFEALDQRAKSVSVLKELARILQENGDRQARDDVYRKILVLQPGDPDAEAALGQAPPTRNRPASVEVPVVRPPLLTTSSIPAVNETGSQPLVSARYPSPKLDDERPEPAPAPPRPAKSFATGKNDRIEDDDDAPQNVPTAVGRMLDASAPPQSQQADESGEEIARILNETDVYIKYKLYAKAIEHVQRVFEHDAKHVEAREKLKALYLTVGKRDEAVLELWALAEQAEQGRQRRYLREILELDPSNARAASMLGEEAAPPPETKAAEEELLDVDDLEELPEDSFEVADPSGKIDLGGLRDSSDSGDDDLIPLVVDSAADRADDDLSAEDPVEDRFGFDDDGQEPSRTDQRFDAAVESAPLDTKQGPRVEEPAPPTESEANAVESGLAAFDRAKPTRRTPFREEASEDHDVRTRFDDQAMKMMQAEALFGSSSDEIDESELPPIDELKKGTKGTATVPTASLPAHLREDLAQPGPSRPAEPRTEPAPRFPAETLRTQPGNKVPAGEGSKKGAPPPESSMEDDLDEADFFIQQSLFDEARGILQTLLERHPGHPLVTAKMRDVEALERNAGNLDGGQAVPVEAADIEAEAPEELPGSSEADAGVDVTGTEPAFEMTRKGVIEKGVTAEDFETHYDLGIAYKEMGLLDDAMTEFKLVMKDPTREVQCHLMIGLCLLEKGQQTEAIGHFKKGLYVEGITERESLSLYFELGQAYERLGDPREALYYYEKVQKRDPRFRNVERLVEALRSGSVVEPVPAPQHSADDVDAAFDNIVGSND
jgi:tetratricopeptide (TPR) repeat protein